jgi:hypothetical protein
MMVRSSRRHTRFSIRLLAVITGELKAKVDRIWDAFWSGGIANPLEVMEQITYLRRRSRPDVRGPALVALACNLHPRRATKGLRSPAAKFDGPDFVYDTDPMASLSDNQGLSAVRAFDPTACRGRANHVPGGRYAQ